MGTAPTPTQTTDLTINQWSTYKLRWTVPRGVAVTNSFVNPDETSQDFPDPDPAPDGQTPTVVKITLKKGKNDAEAKPEAFREGRSAPTSAPGKAKNSLKQLVDVTEYSAVFLAREPGVYIFTIEVPGKTIVQHMTVTKRYRTIKDVLDDPEAVRRQKILARIAEVCPAFNTHADAAKAANHKIGDDPRIVDNGPWVASYGFDGSGGATSCTSVQPWIMTSSMCEKKLKKDERCPDHPSNGWAFDAGPADGKAPNKAWVFASRTSMPNVGDTYILNNGWGKGYFGHVGIVVHIPTDGTGLWVTMDGGQGKRPKQYAHLVPRWGLMGAELPAGGNGAYKSMQPGPEDPPFLSGATADAIKKDAPVPTKPVGDPAAIIDRIVFKETTRPQDVSNPRRLLGYVNVDDPDLKFDCDGRESSQEILDKVKLLQGKVEKVIACGLRGGIVGGDQT